MRVTALVLTLAACLAGSAPAVSAGPITFESPTDTLGWGDDVPRAFSLSKLDGTYTLSVEGLGTTHYPSLTECCEDVFGRVLQLYPGGSLHFSRLVINTLPVSTEFWDDLNLTFLQRAGLDNLGTLTGLVTLDAPTGPRLLSFSAPMFVERVPEPAAVALVAGGLLVLRRHLRRRRRD